jgi:uncharacterized Fe-S center protein
MSEVVWVDTRNMTVGNTVVHKLQRLIRESGAVADLSEGMRVALKVNTAEEGYAYGLRPSFLRSVTDAVASATKTRPTVCDGHKLVDYWKGSGGNTFLKLSSVLGYSNETLGGHFVINGGFSGDEGNLYACDGQDSEIGGVEVGTAVCRSDALWVLSHVTLHPLFGLSGALLNGGFDCLVGRSKTRILQNIDPYLFNGQRPPLQDLQVFQRRALESHLGVKAAMGGRIFYVNYLWDITPQPEYFPYSEEPVVGNLGFMASRDPVALDAATFDIIRQNQSNSAKMAEVNFEEVLKTAEMLGVGSVIGTINRLS